MGELDQARSTFASALATAQDIHDADLRAYASLKIAEAQTEAGDFDGALAIARNLDEAWSWF